MSSFQGNKKIAKNTALLFFRTAVSMVIALFSSRLILQNLGVSDYGVYNVVGGIVAMLTALSGPLKGITYRYIAYAIGKSDANYQKDVFSASVKIHVILAISIFLLLETIGVWYINSTMNLPEGRLQAANTVFQLSTIAFIMNVIAMPFHSAIVAYERFKVYAYVDIIVAILNLGIAYSLTFCFGDRMIYYALMHMLVQTFAMGFYMMYTIHYFKNCKIDKIQNKRLYKEILDLTGWNFVGTASATIYTQGSSLILNFFWGVLLNAAMGVASQVSNAVSSFVNSFTIAINPQITKNYAEGNIPRTTELVFLGAKITSSLLLLIGFPVVLNIEYLLKLWLVEVPEYSEIFVTLTLLAIYLGAFNNSLNMLILSTGKIKSYQLGCFLINVSAVFLLYIIFYVGIPAFYLYVILGVTNIVKTILLLALSYRYIAFPVRSFFVSIYLKGLLLIGLIIIAIIIKNRILNPVNFTHFLCETILALMITFFLIYGFYLSNKERLSLKVHVMNKLQFI